MILNKILASYTFRFMSGYVVGLSIAVFLVLAVIYSAISRDYFASVHETIYQELDDLTVAYQQGGVEAVDAFVDAHAAPDRLIRFFYLVVDENHRKIAGNLDAWPESRQYSGGWLGFDLDAFSGDWDDVGTEFVARSQRLPSGETVLVARHYADVINSAKLVGGALTRSMVATIILGTIGGALVAGLSVKRIDALNRSINRIMSGDLNERVDTTGTTGDYKRLGENLNKMLDKIVQLMEGVRQVSDNIAHDLRTPLTRLRNKLSDLQQEVAPERREAVQGLIDEADGLLATFSALLRITQVESGNRRAGFADVDLRVILMDVVELYEPLATDKSLSVSSDLGAVPMIRGDRDLLFQAFANLVDNAIKYTPPGGCVSIQLLKRERDILLEVIDSGPGIAAQDREKVFRRFYRVEASRGCEPGNGLGLSLVQAVIKLHNGSIDLLDNYPGLRAAVRFPLAPTTA